MSWEYWKFPRHLVVEEKFEIRGSNIIISHYHYREDPNVGKCVCAIFRIPCTCQACVDQLDNCWLPNCSLSSQPRYAHIENCYYKKLI